MGTTIVSWDYKSLCIQFEGSRVQAIAQELYEKTCRFDFDAPWFCVLNVGSSIDSVSFRQLMIDLKDEMDAVHQSKTQSSLNYLSAARFDQQESTRPHLDGGPEECFLMLGYEPSEVDSELEIFDYTRCAYDHGLSPNELLSNHNPMFQDGYELLKPYSTRAPCFSRGDYQIVCINNSYAPYSEGRLTWQGTLHTAKILTPDDSKRRVINSTMIASTPLEEEPKVSEAQLREFVQTSAVRRRGYDRLHLEEDE